MMISRRGLLSGLVGLIAAPAIVRVDSLMPIKAWIGDGIALNSMVHPTSLTQYMLSGYDAFGRLTTEVIDIETGWPRTVTKFREISGFSLLTSSPES